MENFETVIREYRIQIPIIQRDYAQGRNDRKAVKIRANFLNSIFETLISGKSLHLDFIYGSKEQNKFIPLDGQQRLTTLFLLYWYFGKKEKKDIGFLNNFTYETRASSREFCNKLVSSEIDFSSKNISDIIRDSNWFMTFWENDPTIQGMLQMIEDIHLKFYDFNFYDNLGSITFNFFELEKFGLDDDLYIKMNARGKALTEFENFKAKFEQFLHSVNITLKNEFSFKIDNEWTDLFWKYGVEDNTHLIDEFFMNYFYYITEMIYYKYSEVPLSGDFDFNLIKSIYSNEENIKFLFKSIDNLEIILQSHEIIFSKNEHEEDKVCLFDDNINIVEKVIKTGSNSINIQYKILSFIIITHLIPYEINNELKDLIRIARNLTYRIKHLKSGSIIYTNDTTFVHIHYLLNLFLELINKDVYSELLIEDKLKISGSSITKVSLEYEVSKAFVIKENILNKKEIFRLEDYHYLKGDIHNFLVSDNATLASYNDSIREIYSQDDGSIIRAMLAIGDYRLNIGWTYNKYFFGKGNYWEVILTAQSSEDFSYTDFFQAFFSKFQSSTGGLEEMINSFLLSNSNWDWRYYFVKYESMTKQVLGLSKDNNIYLWEGDFEIEKMGGSNLNAYHLNPFIKTVSEKTDIQAYIVQGANKSYLRFNNHKIQSTNIGWVLSLNSVEEIILLKETASKDRIEVLLDYIETHRTPTVT